MSTSRGMYIRNTAYIILNLEDIRNADMNELSEMPAVALERFKISKVINHHRR